MVESNIGHGCLHGTIRFPSNMRMCRQHDAENGSQFLRGHVAADTKALDYVELCISCFRVSFVSNRACIALGREDREGC